VDLSSYRGYFLESVTVAAAPSSTAAIAMTRGAGEHAVLTLTHVLHLAMDSPGDWDDFIDEISVRRLPRTGPWPPEARHLLQHHNNDSDLLWIRLTGPTQIEIVARTLTAE
jgi:hypothetical protein